MDILFTVIKIIWFVVLAGLIVGAIWLFIRTLKEAHQGKTTGLTGNFYDGENPAYSLLSQKSERRDICWLILIFFAVRLAQFALVFLGKQLFEPGFSFSFSGLEGQLFRWDTTHYTGIAENWYQNQGDARFHIVFYPFYPILIRLFYYIVWDYSVAAMLVSNLSIAFAIAVFYKLLRIDFSKETTKTAITLFAFHPFSFFCSLAMTESTFLLITLLFFFFLRKEKWVLAGLMGFFATLTRNFGLLFVIPYGVWLIIISVRKKYSFGKFMARLLPGFLILAGFGVYLCINKSITGNWFQFMIYQKEHWSQEISCIWKNAVNPYIWFFQTYRGNPSMQYFTWLPLILSEIIAVISIILKWKQVPFVYKIYALAYLFLTLTASWPLSGSRYLMLMFPMYISYGLICDKKWKKWLACSIGFVFGVYMLAGYMTWQQVM